MNAPLPDWRSDWLYALVLREAEEDWRHCGRTSDQKIWQYVLIEEWSSVGRDMMCCGKVLRAWVRDADGLREITLAEYKQHKGWIRGRVYPFIILQFFIYSDRERVVLGSHLANTFGSGGRYLVQGQGDDAKLVWDPKGSAWIT